VRSRRLGRPMVGCLLAVMLTGLLWLVPGAQAQRTAAANIALALQPASITADGVSTSAATVTVTDGTGTGVPGETITLSSSDPNQTISTVSDNGNGTYTATITSSTTVGAPTITASDQTAGLTTSQTLIQTPGVPSNISLTLQPSSITADGASTSTATATLTDALGHRVSGQAVTFSSTDSGESISGVSDNGNGTYTAAITSSTTPGTPTITASDGVLTAQQTLTQTPGQPSHIALALQPSRIIAGGQSSSTAVATVTDRAGHGVPGQTVAFSSTDAGNTISGVTYQGNGDYSATITSSSRAGRVTITAADSGLQSRQTLTQAPGPPMSITLALSPASITADGVSTSTATAMVTDGPGGSGNPVPGETITLVSSDPNEQISGVTDNNDGTYTATITSSTTAETATITASDGAASLTTQQSLVQTPGPAANVVVTVQPPVIKADGSATATATATVTDQFGNAVSSDPVTFSSSNAGDTVFNETQNGNVYTASIRSSFTPGNSTILATDRTTHAHGQAVLKEVSLSSTVSLVSSPSSALTNQNVTLVASVGSSGSPYGTIDFFRGLVLIPGCTGLPVSPGSPPPVCLTSFAASSSPVPLEAVFTPSSSSTVAGSSASISLPVAKDSTSVSLRPTSPALNVGVSDTVTAYVGPTLPGGVSPTGSVEFENGTNPIPGCTSVPLGASFGGYTASCNVTYQAVGTHQVSAIYSGDQNFSGSTSSVQIPVVPRGFLPVTMQWLWGWGTRSTGVVQLQVNALSPGTTVTVACKGHGCPFAIRRTTLRRGVRCTPTGSHKCRPHSGGTIDLAAMFRGHRLAVGTQVIVEIRRPGWVGKYYSFKMRSRRLPLIRTLCLAPGASKPGVNCSR
jgi:hypothetical protein